MYGCCTGALKVIDLKTQVGFTVQIVKQRSTSMLIKAPLLKYLKLVDLTNWLVSWWPFSHPLSLHRNDHDFSYICPAKPKHSVNVHAIIYRIILHITLYVCGQFCSGSPGVRQWKEPTGSLRKLWRTYKTAECRSVLVQLKRVSGHHKACGVDGNSMYCQPCLKRTPVCMLGKQSWCQGWDRPPNPNRQSRTNTLWMNKMQSVYCMLWQSSPVPALTLCSIVEECRAWPEAWVLFRCVGDGVGGWIQHWVHGRYGLVAEVLHYLFRHLRKDTLGQCSWWSLQKLHFYWPPWGGKTLTIVKKSKSTKFMVNCVQTKRWGKYNLWFKLFGREPSSRLLRVFTHF